MFNLREGGADRNRAVHGFVKEVLNYRHFFNKTPTYLTKLFILNQIPANIMTMQILEINR
jgi:hypothetical protein